MKNRIIFSALSFLAISTLCGCIPLPQIGETIIKVSNSVSLKEGETYQIDISIEGREEVVIYRSDNEEVVTVNNDGLVTALKEGQANVSAITKNFQETITFNVSKKITYLQYTIKDGVDDLSFLEGYPWLNTSVYGNIKKIEKPRLNDDYFANVNYDYLQTVTIPEGKERWGSVFETQDVLDQYLDEIFTASDSKAKVLLDLVSKGDKQAVKNEVERLQALSDAQVLDMIQSKDSLLGLSRLFSLVHVTGNDELRLNVPYTSAAKGLMRVCISVRYDESYEDMADEIVSIANALGVNISNLKSRMQNMVHKLGQLYFDAYTVNGDCKNKTTVKDINDKLGTTFDVYRMLKSVGVDDDQKLFYSDFTANYAKCYEKFSVSDWKDYLILKAIFDGRYFLGADTYYSMLPDLETVNDEDYDETLTIEEMKRNIVRTNFYDVFEREYIKRFITNEEREKMLELIKEVKDEFYITLEEQDWLSSETKAQAQIKLNEMNYIAFYTDEYVASPEYVVNSNNVYDEWKSYNEYYANGVVKQVIDNDSLANWSNAVINAAYSSLDNNFKIFHGLVAKGMKEITSEARLYGLYGTTIGHEISHGFDNNGAKYDKDGFKSDWWTPEDKAKFEEKVRNISNTYTNVLSGFRDQKFNGEKLSGEIIADMGGLKVISNLAKKKNMDLDEMFRGYAYSEAFVYTEESALERVKTDAHPLSYLRCNMTIAQFDIFQETYNITEDDVMYIPENARICIW